MREKVRILLVGELPDKSWCPPFGELWTLQEKGLIELAPVAAERRIPASLDAHGIICRPSRGGHLTPEILEPPNRPLVLGTLSKGTDHIQLEAEWISDTIHVVGEGNARAVADLTVTLASEVLRPVNEAATEMLFRGWKIDIEPIAQQLDELTWGCLGTGDQVKYLLPQLVGRRCAEVVIFHPALDAARFEYATSGLSTIGLSRAGNSLRLEVPRPGGGTTIVSGVGGCNDFDSFLASVDVLSLHVPAQSKEGSKYEFCTEGIIATENIAKMKDHVRIINVARGALVNEEDVVKALSDRTIGGFAADVIHPTAESAGDPAFSPLWTELCRLDEARSKAHVRERRLFLTPHIGGGTREALSTVTADVLPRFLQALGLI